MAKTKPIAPTTTPMLKLEDFDSTNARMTLRSPVNFQPIEGAWLEIAGIHSQEFEDAKIALMLKSKAEGFNADLSEEDRMRVETLRIREATGRLIVKWNEDFFGPFSTEAAVKTMTHPQRVWMYVQVEDFLKRQENFFKA